MQVTVFAAKMWLTIFVVIMQMGVSIAIMLVVLSAVHYAHGCCYCNYAGEPSFIAITVQKREWSQEFSLDKFQTIYDHLLF